jgi:hypothetical protein
VETTPTTLFSKCDAIKQYYKSIIMSLEQLIHATRPLSPTASRKLRHSLRWLANNLKAAERWVKEMHYKRHSACAAWLCTVAVAIARLLARSRRAGTEKFAVKWG